MVCGASYVRGIPHVCGTKLTKTNLLKFCKEPVYDVKCLALQSDGPHYCAQYAPTYFYHPWNAVSDCKVQPRCALLGYPFHNTAAHTEAMPTREGI